MSYNNIEDLSYEFLGSNESLVLLPLGFTSKPRDEFNSSTQQENFKKYNISEGSAIIARRSEDGQDPKRKFVIDFEGNIYKASNLKKFSEKLKSALARQLNASPTKARLWVSEAELQSNFKIIGIANLEQINAHIQEEETDLKNIVSTMEDKDANDLLNWAKLGE